MGKANGISLSTDAICFVHIQIVWLWYSPVYFTAEKHKV